MNSLADQVYRQADAAIERVADTHCSERGFWLRNPQRFLREVAAHAYLQGIADATINRQDHETTTVHEFSP